MRGSLNVTGCCPGWRTMMIKTAANRRRNRAARAYLAALHRLIEGKATHPDYAGRPVRVTPAAVAKEARRSRNPLYTTHRARLAEDRLCARDREIAARKSSSAVAQAATNVIPKQVRGARAVSGPRAR